MKKQALHSLITPNSTLLDQIEWKMEKLYFLLNTFKALYLSSNKCRIVESLTAGNNFNFP